MEFSIGSNIIAQRNKHDIGQKELADALGITKNRLYNYEKDKAEPTIEILLNLARYFNITLEELITGKAVPQNLKPDEKELLERYQKLDDINKGKLLERATILCEN